jgi:septum formation protein
MFYQDKEFILASTSPRRKELLKLIGISPLTINPNFKESKLKDESIYGFLERVSIGKGQSVLKENYYNSILISSDTIVVIDNKIIGKPKDRDDAFDILKELSGRKHKVITGIAIHYRGKLLYDYGTTAVIFEELDNERINYYLNNENYSDKAGAYAIQGLASVFIKKIDGCFFNVMGFPLNLFDNILRKII